MNTLKYILLLHKKLSGKLSEPEQKDLIHWLEETENQQTSKQVSGIWDLSKQYKSAYEPDLEQGLSRLKKRMQADRSAASPLKVRRSNRSRRFSWAAAAAVLLIASAWWVSQNLWGNAEQLAKAEINIEEVTLPDGTVVVMNEHSTIHYPKSFDGEKFRLVRFSGEAYFKVKSNPAQPFLILTDHTEVRVLGTAFNLRAYRKESFTEVEVEEGHVRFSSKDGSRSTELQANDRGILTRQGRLRVQESPQLNAHSWRTEKLSFQNTPLSQVVPALERHFKIKVKLSNEVRRCTFTTTFDEETNLEDVWAQMKLSGGFTAETQPDGEILISGSACQ